MIRYYKFTLLLLLLLSFSSISGQKSGIINKIYKLEEKGKFIDALEIIEGSISLKPTAHLYSHKAFCLMGLNSMDSAFYYYNKSIAMDSMDYEVWNFLGTFYFLKDNNTEALKAYTKSISLFEHFDAYYNRSLTYIELGDFENALIDINNAFQGGGGQYDYYYTRIEILINQSKFNDALLDIKQAHLFTDKDDFVNYAEAFCLYSLEKYEKALPIMLQLYDNRFWEREDLTVDYKNFIVILAKCYLFTGNQENYCSYMNQLREKKLLNEAEEIDFSEKCKVK